MFQRDRHEARVAATWNEAEARTAILEIAASALARFDAEKLWPAHSLDGAPDGMANIYMGASGVILALDYLKRVGAVQYAQDFAPVMPGIAERDNVWLKNMPMGAYGSLLFGDLGTQLVAECLAPDRQLASRIYARAEDNNALPLLELMWGTPGSMVGCLIMHHITGEAWFESLYRKQAARLLADIEDVGGVKLWTQELYGRRKCFLGLVHGFAGNMFALVRGWNWLDDDQQRLVSKVAKGTIAATAKRSELGANWPACADQPDEPMLVQICHGAPGIITGLADAPFGSTEFDELLVEAGELTWAAGPLKKGSNFCHGTGGNAYALLKLHKRTGDVIWLDRARAFAMHSIWQLRAATREHGRGRYSLWTGDVGLAVCLWNCVTGAAEFPGLDVI